MDTIDYKEKYNQAFKLAKNMFLNPQVSNVITKNLVTLFPKLEEYKGEKIRNILIQEFSRYKCAFAGLEPKDIIAWLEEIAEPNWCHHKVDLSNCSEEYCKAYYDGWNNCNMQHSQCEAEKKPIEWRKEDEDSLNYIIDCLFNCLNCDTKYEEETRRAIAWIQELKERIKGELL